jgi:hypothetical protein
MPIFRFSFVQIINPILWIQVKAERPKGSEDEPEYKVLKEDFIFEHYLINKKMKSLYLFLLVLSFPLLLSSQTIPNASFDSVYFGGIDRIFDWVTSDNFLFNTNITGDTVYALEPNTLYGGIHWSEMLYGVHFAFTPYSSVGVRLNGQPERYKISGEPFETFIFNGTHFTTDEEGYPDFSTGGTPFPYRPTALKGYYRLVDSLSAIENFGKCVVLLKKYNPSSGTSDTIAHTLSTLDLNPTFDWKPFEIPLNYYSSETPDTILIAFFAGFNHGEPTVFEIDEISFDFTSAVQEVGEEKGPILYPNPNSGILYLETGDRNYKSYRILDQQGRVLKSSSFENPLSLPGINSPSLFLQLVNEGGKVEVFQVRTQR